MHAAGPRPFPARSVAKPDPFGSASRTSPSPRTVCSVTRARRRSIHVHVPDRAIRLYRGPACGHARNSNCSSAIETMSAVRPSCRAAKGTSRREGWVAHHTTLWCSPSKRKLCRSASNSSSSPLLVRRTDQCPVPLNCSVKKLRACFPIRLVDGGHEHTSIYIRIYTCMRAHTHTEKNTSVDTSGDHNRRCTATSAGQPGDDSHRT